MYDIYIYTYAWALPNGAIEHDQHICEANFKTKPSFFSADLGWQGREFVLEQPLVRRKICRNGTPKPLFSWEANILYQYKFPDTPCNYGISTYICYKQ